MGGCLIQWIGSVSSSTPDTVDTKRAVSGPAGSRYSGYGLYLAQFQIQWIRPSHLGLRPDDLTTRPRAVARQDLKTVVYVI